MDIRKYCNICNISVHRSSFAKHLRSNNHRLNSGDNQKCNVCNVFIPTSEYEEHLESENHLRNANRGVTRRCEPCNKDVKVTNYDRHILTQFHLNNVGRMNNTYQRCEICNVNITRNQWDRHLQTQRHMRATNPPTQRETIPSLIELAKQALGPRYSKKEIDKYIAANRINPFVLTRQDLAEGYIVKIDMCHLNYHNAKVIIKPSFNEILRNRC